MPLQAGPFVPCASAGFHRDRLSVASLGEYYSCPPPLYQCCIKSMGPSKAVKRCPPAAGHHPPAAAGTLTSTSTVPNVVVRVGGASAKALTTSSACSVSAALW